MLTTIMMTTLRESVPLNNIILELDFRSLSVVAIVLAVVLITCVMTGVMRNDGPQRN